MFGGWLGVYIWIQIDKEEIQDNFMYNLCFYRDAN